jgi:hypothetical protein
MALSASTTCIKAGASDPFRSTLERNARATVASSGVIDNLLLGSDESMSAQVRDKLRHRCGRLC